MLVVFLELMKMTGIRKIHDFDDEKIKEMKSSYL